MAEETHFTPEDQRFIDRAIDFCQQMGERAVLTLIGSRAASFTDAWSDLDLCIIGDKQHLSDEDRKTYEQSWQLFVDRGDFEAHWSFYDEEDLQAWLKTYPDEMMWVIANSRVLHKTTRALNLNKYYTIK